MSDDITALMTPVHLLGIRLRLVTVMREKAATNIQYTSQARGGELVAGRWAKLKPRGLKYHDREGERAFRPTHFIQKG